VPRQHERVDGGNGEEEAGLIGEWVEEPIGWYRHAKQNERYHVVVYAMRITVVPESWLEAEYRHRRFMSVEDALTRLNPVLHRFVRDAARLVRAQGSGWLADSGRSAYPKGDESRRDRHTPGWDAVRSPDRLSGEARRE
jgi:hypothetical protein